MRRSWMWVGVTAAALGCGSALWSAFGTADEQKPLQAKQEEGSKATQLPIGQVVLYSSGVGYFQREGAVEGTARVDLSFPVADINDLIKSMVLRDLDGGHVSAVSYDSNAPLDRTLRSFAINLSANPTYADILTHARGERAEVVLTNAGPGAASTLNGVIVGVEAQRQAVGKEVVEGKVLNLWCADGLRSVRLADVQRVRFLNAGLDSEFRKALETLAKSHDTQKKAVSVRFVGEGKRQVRVGYVIENPIWKTSYRLVLGSKKGEEPYLQGWAVVENPSDEDWKDVRMALVSGRPISFQMDLYQPLYVRRPVVVPELFQSLNPVAYSGSINGVDPGKDGAPEDKAERGGMFKKHEKLDKASQMRRGGASVSFGLATPAKAQVLSLQLSDESRTNLALGRSVSTAATATRLGDFFQYLIDKPVSLPRQKSALLPIVGKDVQASRVSIYNESTQPKFPLLGLRFKNTSGLHLMQGPVTVFEGSRYAGDARVLDLQPGEERLLSYAVDLGTEVNPVPTQDSGRIVHVKAVKGILQTTHKQRQGKTYTVKNRNDAQRTVLVEHPVNNAFTLVGTAKPTETAADVYRFEMKVPAGGTKSLTVTEERQFRQDWSVSNQNDEQIRLFLSQAVTSDKVKEGLHKAMELRWALAKTQRETGEVQKQLTVITEDQTRLRANLREMPSTAKAYKRYLEKFDQQETLIEKYQADIKRLQGVEHTQRKEMDDFLASFSAE